MEIAILEMPSEKVFRINVDNARIAGYFKRDPHKDPTRYLVYPGDHKQPLHTQPHSREGAAMLIVYHHFEQERKKINEARRHGVR